jgi:hypothetical protein
MTRHANINYPRQTIKAALGGGLRSKRIIADTLRSHSRPAQEVETTIAVTVLNRMLDLGRSESVRAA